MLRTSWGGTLEIVATQLRPCVPFICSRLLPYEANSRLAA